MFLETSTTSPVQKLYLANNKLTGPLPNLTGMDSLNYVDLSNNSFVASDVPEWFSSLQSLTSLIMERARIQGQLPVSLFSLPQLQTIVMKNNQINGTLDMGSRFSTQLKLIDLQTTSSMLLLHELVTTTFKSYWWGTCSVKKE